MAGWKRIEVTCPVCKHSMKMETAEIDEENQVLRLQMDCTNQDCVVHEYGEVVSHTIAARGARPTVTIADRSPSRSVH